MYEEKFGSFRFASYFLRAFSEVRFHFRSKVISAFDAAIIKRFFLNCLYSKRLNKKDMLCKKKYASTRTKNKIPYLILHDRQIPSDPNQSRAQRPKTCTCPWNHLQPAKVSVRPIASNRKKENFFTKQPC